MSVKKIVGLVLGAGFLGLAIIAITVVIVSSNIPEIITVEDYSPLLSSEVYDREGNKIGEFFRERRILIPYEEIPEVIKQAFIAAEDDTFYEHGGVNYFAIMRAMFANIKAGHKVQGASTITQQVARSLLLTRSKTYTRKIKEVILAYKMEANLSKEEILYLYLNQIYLGQGAYGVGAATKIYYRKPIKDITVAEAAMLAGLPKAPSRYSPTRNPKRAKERQRYVIKRMIAENFVAEEEGLMAAEEPLQVYLREDFKKMAPFYLETVRQMLVKHLGEEMVLDQGIRIYTGIDLAKQLEANEQVKKGLQDLDKRQGYRGPISHNEDPQEIAEFLLKERNSLMDEITPVRVVRPDGTIEDKGPLNLTGFALPEEGEVEVENAEPRKLPNVPEYINIDQIVKGIVTRVDDEWGLVTVRFAESRGLIDVETMEWAREPDPNINFKYANKVEKPSKVFKKGDIILVKVVGKRFYSKRVSDLLSDKKKAFRRNKKNKGQKWERPETLPEFKEFARIELEQEPVAEAALLSVDQKTEEIIAMVGGYDFEKSQFNRTYQAARQTGSSFKSLVYTAALDKNFTPATPIMDAPIVFEEEEAEGQDQSLENAPEEEKPTTAAVDGEEEEVVMKKWKPMNHSKRFQGDILFRNALIRSLNVPTVKIIEKTGIHWVADYARRLGFFSPLNMDYTLALGSSSVTLYEITKAFSQLGRLGKRVRPLLVHKVEDKDGKVLLQNLTLDERFTDALTEIDEKFEERRLAYLEYKRNPQKYLNDLKKDSELEDTSDEITPGQNNEATEVEEPKNKMAKEPPLFFNDPDQLIKPSTAFIATTILKGAVEERGGTGLRAKSLGRPAAGKTGTTNGYFDAWFVGYTPQISTGVWVGYDTEKSLGSGEVGGRAALPIWLDYMKFAHEGVPARDFSVPEGITFANIDNDSGMLASADSKTVVRQAFSVGTEPKEISGESSQEEEENFYKEDLSE